jgi:hypothetical protein
LGIVNEVPNSSPDSAVKSLDLQPLFLRTIGGIDYHGNILNGTVVNA